MPMMASSDTGGDVSSSVLHVLLPSSLSPSVASVEASTCGVETLRNEALCMVPSTDTDLICRGVEVVAAAAAAADTANSSSVGEP